MKVKMNKEAKKLLAALAVFAMVFAAASVVGFSDDSAAAASDPAPAKGPVAGFATLQEAIEKTENGKTIVLTGDVTEDIVIPTGKDVTIDLGGHKIVNKTSSTDNNKAKELATIVVNKDAKLTIVGNGTVTSTATMSAALNNYGTAVILGGTFTQTGGDWATILNFGTMTIGADDVKDDVVKISKNSPRNPVIRNGYFSAGDLTRPLIGIQVPVLNIVSGTFDNGRIVNEFNSVINIDGGVFGTEVIVKNSNIVNINGGVFKNAGMTVMDSFRDAKYGVGQLTVNGGSFACTNADDSLINFYDDVNDSQLKAKVAINGGDFKTANIIDNKKGQIDLTIGTLKFVGNAPATISAKNVLIDRDTVVSGTVSGDVIIQIGTANVKFDSFSVLKGADVKITAAPVNTLGAVASVTFGNVEIDSGASLTLNMPVSVDDKKKVTNNGNLLVDGDGKLELGNGQLFLNQNSKTTINGDGKMVAPTATSIIADAEAVVDTSSVKSIVNGAGEPYYPEYVDGTTVVIEGVEYTVFHQTIGKNTFQFGISCGEIHYTGVAITNFEVVVSTVSLTAGYKQTNQGFDLETEFSKVDWIGEGEKPTEYKIPGTYKNAVKVQITLSSADGTSYTINKKVDLVIKPTELKLGVEAIEGEIYGGIGKEFQNLTVVQKGNVFKISGALSYYNGAISTGLPIDETGGYYLALKFSVKDHENMNVAWKDVAIKFTGSDGTVNDFGYAFDGFMVWDNTNDVKRAEALMNTPITVKLDMQYSDSPEFVLDLSGIKIVAPLDVTADKDVEKFQNGIAIKEDANDHTKFYATGKLLWQADVNGEFGWFFQYTFDGKNNTVRVVDNTEPIAIPYTNGTFKTNYTIDLTGIEFESVAGYGSTKASFYAAFNGLYGLDKDLAYQAGDKYMFMVFNTMNVTSEMTAQAMFDGKSVYTENFVFTDASKHIGIWYFDMSDGKYMPGKYVLSVFNGKDLVATAETYKSGVIMTGCDYNDDMKIAVENIKKMSGTTIADPLDKMFYGVFQIYWDTVPSATNYTYQVYNSENIGIVNANNAFDFTAMENKGMDYKWSVYSSFDHPSVTGGYKEGIYQMKILLDGEPVQMYYDGKYVDFGSITVATESNVTITEVVGNVTIGKIDNDVADFITPGEYLSDDFKLTGQLNYFKGVPINGYENGYYVPISVTGTKVVTGTQITFSQPFVAQKDNAYGQYLVYIAKGVEQFTMTVDFDGDKTVYKPTTYKFIVDPKIDFNAPSFEIILVDDLYGKDGLNYKSANVGDLILLPNGPNADKTFKGWMLEDGKTCYNGGSLFFIEGIELDANLDGKITFVATYEAEKPVEPEIPADRQQRTEYTIDSLTFVDGKLTVKVNSSETDKNKFMNIVGSHYYFVSIKDLKNNTILQDVFISKSIVSGGNVCSEVFEIPNIDVKGKEVRIVVEFNVDYGMQKINLAQKSMFVNFHYGADSNDVKAEIDTQMGAGSDIKDVAPETAFIVDEFEADKEYSGIVMKLGDDGKLTVVYTEKLTFTEAGKHVWYFSMAAGQPSYKVGGSVVDALTADEAVEDAIYYMYVFDGSKVVSDAYFQYVTDLI